ncbi:hypothetical protein CNMCM8980_005839 [Aspergillus fumigatiaffinis]|uniref:Uncharacterized protein n=1 Tax=Aspergillus fumigatiaffinis TaxID=340414 RepID=A0A8H4HHT2_9EURO|nr:hypothetical protein CNMCM5878_007593 [Aspergillus fumigatiaffinis]KAF4231213.1 hypothetical protein CNMCM6457_005614 [Aspergillus fumigatiaffinis]KAF4244486.1 hypothetical protein CNMCM6805_008738 [Aspergillus fumigatiaffinis]KAF4248475.1 hypothetical protein CNMCM8980_005839 [Aspergillus fumigatiaffinis]
MKGVITILTMAIATTALAFPHRWVRDNNSTNTDTVRMPAPILVPTTTTKLLPPDTTLVPSLGTKLFPPSVSAATAQLDSTNKVLVTLTPAPSPSPNSNSNSKSNLKSNSKSKSKSNSKSNSPAASKSDPESKDGKKVHIVGSVS